MQAVAAASSRPTLIDALWPSAQRPQALRRAVLMLLGTVLLTLSAKLQVPFWPVPMTMQTFVVLLLGAAYGWRLAGATLLLYLAEGAIGLPVFANTPERGLGIAYMAGPTGGYLFGFLIAAVAVGWLAERGWDRSPGRVLAIMLLGHALIFLPGVAWLATFIGPADAVEKGFSVFWLGTLLKTGLAAAVLYAGCTLLRRA